MTAAYHLSIRGKVQGVGYRNAMELTARRMGVAGWVRNRSDGSVEAHIEGDQAMLDKLVKWCWQGPATSYVLAVAQTTVDAEGLAGFVRKPTV